MFFLPFIFALITSCTKDTVALADGDPDGQAAINKPALLQFVNDARKKGCNCGSVYYAPVAPLTWNDRLEKAANRHSNDMFRKKYFGHTGSDGSGSGERISGAGYSWKFYGENIAQGYSTEKAVVAGWLSSPGHCANIMNRNFKEMGVARVGGYWTQDFGSPLIP